MLPAVLKTTKLPAHVILDTEEILQENVKEVFQHKFCRLFCLEYFIFF